jgi:hypothetical protein
MFADAVRQPPMFVHVHSRTLICSNGTRDRRKVKSFIALTTESSGLAIRCLVVSMQSMLIGCCQSFAR